MHGARCATTGTPGSIDQRTHQIYREGLARGEQLDDVLGTRAALQAAIALHAAFSSTSGK